MGSCPSPGLSYTLGDRRRVRILYPFSDYCGVVVRNPPDISKSGIKLTGLLYAYFVVHLIERLNFLFDYKVYHMKDMVNIYIQKTLMHNIRQRMCLCMNVQNRVSLPQWIVVLTSCSCFLSSSEQSTQTMSALITQITKPQIPLTVILSMQSSQFLAPKDQ